MINKYSNIPLYSQLKNLIIQKIEAGEYLENSQIPSEQEFCDQYKISRPTVRQAISELTNNGYLYKEKGKGTFVAKTKARIDIKNYSGFTDSILDSPASEQHSVIAVRVITGSEIPRLDEIFMSAGYGSYGSKPEYAEIKFTTSLNNETLSLNISYIPLILFPEIIEGVKSKKPSYDLLRGKYPLIPARSKSSLEIVYTEQSDAQYLHVQPGQALILIENVLYSKSGQAVEYIITKYRADKSKLVFENTK